MSDKYAWAPIRTEPAYRVAAQALRTRIVTGEIAVGSVLPSETAMAEMLEVNRSTIREAIRLLEENGIVARKPGGKKPFRKQSSSGANDNASENRRPPRRRRQNTRRDAA